MLENKEDNFRLVGMDIFNFSLKTHPNFGQLKEVEYHYSIETRVNENLKQIIHAPEVKIFDSLDKNEALAHLTITLAFEIDSFSESTKKNENGTFSIDFEVDKKFAIIGLHTLRGVAFSLFKGTYLQNAILPIVQHVLLNKQELL